MSTVGDVMATGSSLRDPLTFLPAPRNSGEPLSYVRLRGLPLPKDLSEVTPVDEELFNIVFNPCVSGSGLSLASARFQSLYAGYCAAGDIRHCT